MPLQNISGKKFGKLTVVGLIPIRDGVRIKWECRCDCGKTKIVQAGHLRSGHTVSCGCVHDKKAGDRFRKHGLAKTPPWACWMNMKARCYLPACERYPNYGGRGITVCPQWLDSFEVFWRDMGPTYFKGASIERKDVNGNYTPENCIWVPREEQYWNKTNSVILTLNGVSKCASQWEKEFGWPKILICQRKRMGWTDERILTTPHKKRKSPKKRTISNL